MCGQMLKRWFMAVSLIALVVPCSAAQVQLDIARYFNNDAISTHDAQQLGAIDKGGDSLPAEGFPSSGKLTVSGITFKLPNVSATRNNISCRSQKIMLPKGSYTKIHVLATAVNGSYIDELTAGCADGSIYNLDLAISDWCVTANYNEQTALRFDHRHGQASGQTACSIWKQTMYLRNNHSPVRSVTLPNNPDMHIFAITLE
jgi:hypothetical protein